MCHWGHDEATIANGGSWSKLYEKCKLFKILEVNSLAGEADITEWCGKYALPYLY
jgi:hypothetical protein